MARSLLTLLYALFSSLPFSQSFLHITFLFFLFFFFKISNKTKLLFNIISSNIFFLFFHFQLSFRKYSFVLWLVNIVFALLINCINFFYHIFMLKIIQNSSFKLFKICLIFIFYLLSRLLTNLSMFEGLKKLGRIYILQVIWNGKTSMNRIQKNVIWQLSCCFSICEIWKELGF